MKYIALILVQFLSTMITGEVTTTEQKLSKRNLGIPKGGFRIEFDDNDTPKILNFGESTYRYYLKNPE